VVIVIVAVVLVAGLGALVVRGNQQVDAALDRVRARAVDVRVPPSQILAGAFTTDAGIATSLGIRNNEISMHQAAPPDWCIDVDVRRLGATGHASYLVAPDGVLHAAARC
jgi:hypothetical protein